MARTGLHSPVISSRLPRPPEVTTAAGAATINLFGLVAIAAVAVIVPGLLTGTIGFRHGSVRTTLRCDASCAGPPDRQLSFGTETMYLEAAVYKRAGSGGRLGMLVLKMAGFAVIFAVLSSCAGDGTIEGRHHHHAQRANCPRRRCPCRPTRSARARNFKSNADRTVPRTHRAANRGPKTPLKNSYPTQSATINPQDHRTARRPSRPRQSLQPRNRRLSTGR